MTEKFDFSTLTNTTQSAYNNDVQNKRVWDAKQEAIGILERIARQCQKARDFDCQRTLKIWLTGSSINGFGNKNSDADMCLVTDPSRKMTARKSIIDFLHQMRRKLETERQYITKNAEVIPAKVPILRVYLKTRGMEVQCDINIDNTIGIRNSWLLRCYSELDPRVRPFIYLVKKFAKSANINDAQGGSLSTYAWLLLSLHFLQCGVEEPVIPVVQQLTNSDTNRIYGENFHNDDLNDVAQIAMGIKQKINWQSKNKSSVGELFYQWITYYATSFNFTDWVISVRLGKIMCRFGDDSLRKLRESLVSIQQRPERPRTGSGIFVKKRKRSGAIEISSDEEEEKEQKKSIVVESSDAEEKEDIEVLESKDLEGETVEKEDSGSVSDFDEEEAFEEALEIFGNKECALTCHPLMVNKVFQGDGNTGNEQQNALVVKQRKLIEKHTCKNHFNPSDYPSDRIVICIEEPFQKDNVARAVFDKEKAIKIVRTLRYCRNRIDTIMEENSEMAIKTIVNITQDYMHASPSEITCVLEGKKRKADEFEEGSTSEEEAPPPSKKQKKNTVKRAFTNTMNA